MKIGTDGILIGAWVNVSNKFKALDIGSGTGIISLMLCQRNLNLELDSVELSPSAVMDAKINIENCNWSNRIKLFHQDLKDFHPDSNYDLIVSNPPYIAPSDPHLESLKYEPIKALVSDDNGLKDLKIITKQAKKILTHDGVLIFEHSFDQSINLENILIDSGFKDIFLMKDHQS